MYSNLKLIMPCPPDIEPHDDVQLYRAGVAALINYVNNYHMCIIEDIQYLNVTVREVTMTWLIIIYSKHALRDYNLPPYFKHALCDGAKQAAKTQLEDEVMDVKNHIVDDRK